MEFCINPPIYFLKHTMLLMFRVIGGIVRFRLKTNNLNPEPLGSGKEGRKTLPLPRLLRAFLIIIFLNF